ncbi:unnamed protein product [Paramecium sonneborni]|uniref:Protein kinase domain-containing protein n=1 Tax=Paramecium sonneborni TaxID=65129 RepID=A0A8S1P288_9CILI|nr:unnamed protein product [Paramecium sonneborni]
MLMMISYNKFILDPAYLSRLGSPLYMTLQILEAQPFTAKCDVWSVGLMFYELFCAFQIPTQTFQIIKVKELITLILRVQQKIEFLWKEFLKIKQQRQMKEQLKKYIKRQTCCWMLGQESNQYTKKFKSIYLRCFIRNQMIN